MPGTLYIDTAPFIGGAQMSMQDELKRDPSAAAVLSGWDFLGALPAYRLSTHHWRASLSGAWRLWRDVADNRPLLEEAFARFKPDALYLNTVRSALFVTLCGVETSGIRLVLRDRDIRMPLLLPRFLEARMPLEVVAVSEAVAAKWRKAPVRVEPNRLDEEVIRLTVPHRYPWPGPVVIQVADFVRWKRHDLFLKAFAEAHRSNPKLHGVIKGRIRTRDDARWHEAVLRLRARLGLEESVIVDTSEESALPYIAGGDILVSCAESEPFGRAMEEARILGKPVIDADALRRRADQISNLNP